VTRALWALTPHVLDLLDPPAPAWRPAPRPPPRQCGPCARTARPPRRLPRQLHL